MASYTLLQLINFILRDLQETTVSTVAATTNNLVLYLIDQLNFLMYEIAEAENWDWLYASSSITTVANQQEYSLAADCEMAHAFRQMKTPMWLAKRDLVWLAETYPDFTDSTGDPEGYIPVSWQKIWLDPIPTSVMTINYSYKKFLTRVAGDTDTPQLPEPFQNLLITGLRAMAYKYAGHPDSDKEMGLYLARLQKRITLFREEPPDEYPKLAGWDYGESPYA